MTAELEALERLMRERRSERQFLTDEVAPAIIDRLLEAAASAPSASNRQSYRFMVVTRRETIARMVDAVESALGRQQRTELSQLYADLKDYGRNFLIFGQAPVVVVVFFRASDRLKELVLPATERDAVMQVREALSSAAAAIMQLLLAAHAMGLGACWMTGPCLAEQELIALLVAPEGLRIAALIPIGYCAKRALAPRRRRASQLRLAEPSEFSAVDSRTIDQ